MCVHAPLSRLWYVPRWDARHYRHGWEPGQTPELLETCGPRPSRWQYVAEPQSARFRDTSAKLPFIFAYPQHNLGLGEPEGHVHDPIEVDGGGQCGMSLLPRVGTRHYAGQATRRWPARVWRGVRGDVSELPAPAQNTRRLRGTSSGLPPEPRPGWRWAHARSRHRTINSPGRSDDGQLLEFLGKGGLVPPVAVAPVTV